MRLSSRFIHENLIHSAFSKLRYALSLWFDLKRIYFFLTLRMSNFVMIQKEILHRLNSAHI